MSSVQVVSESFPSLLSLFVESLENRSIALKKKQKKIDLCCIHKQSLFLLFQILFGKSKMSIF